MISIPGYKIIKSIGKGGMATVYLAVQQSIGRQVAIKVMSPALAADPSFSQRFIKEARMANLVHPNIIIVYDAGEINHQNYIVMEYVSGGSLEARIEQGMTIQQTITITKQIASALAYAAQQSIIHRDVKPGNILIRENGSALLVDFGIAKTITSGTQLTRVGSTIGSPSYMSPEQAQGQALDGRSDLYSLGIVFFKALTGSLPYEATDSYAMSLKHISEPIPQLPESLNCLQPIIDKLLAKKPEDRFADGNHLIDALDKIHIEKLAIPKSETLSAERENVSLTKKIPTAIDDLDQQLDQQRKTSTITRELKNQTEGNKQKTGKRRLLFAALLIVIFTVTGIWFFQQHSSTPDTVSAIAPAIPMQTAPSLIKQQAEPDPAPQPKEESMSINEWLGLPAPPSTAEKIAPLLEQAKIALDKRQYTTPVHDNALNLYNQVLSLDANNADALAGKLVIADKYVQLAEKYITRKNDQKALIFIDRGLKVDAANENLLALKEKISARSKPQQVSPMPTLTTHQTILQTEPKLFEFVGIHHSQQQTENIWYAKQDLMNKIYNQILSQCHATAQNLNHPDCLFAYQAYVKQWPLPLQYTMLSTTQAQLPEDRIRFSVQAKQNYRAELNALQAQLQQGLANHFTTQQQLIALANYSLYHLIAPLMGLSTTAQIHSKLSQALQHLREQTTPINNINELEHFLQNKLTQRNIHILPFINKNSFEITPFALSIQQYLTRHFQAPSQFSAEQTLRGEYQFTTSGDIALDLWLFDNDNRVVDIHSVLLTKNILPNKRKMPLLHNTSLLPAETLRGCFGFPSMISIAGQSSNALLTVGQSIRLKVKLNKPGFYFIAVHTIREDGEYSYLLPLREGKIPFVQLTTSEQINRLITLGSFKVTPPLGVEILQLIASNVKLESYLPAYQWDDKRKQFIIQGSEGSIAHGLQSVRKLSGKIRESSYDNNTYWQERLLVTSIVKDS